PQSGQAHRRIVQHVFTVSTNKFVTIQFLLGRSQLVCHDGDAEARQRATRRAAIHDDARVPLEPTPDGLGVKVIASTYQRRGLGLQSDGARCYNSQEFYG
ncbi:MAG: hypothetical protein WAV78_17305, partial [Xanthobacteraceae bacterium]